MATSNDDRHTLILGIGNTLLADDGIGIRVVEELRARSLPGVVCLDGGTLGFSLLETVESAARLIVVDAAELGAPAGSVRRFENGAMDRHLRRGRRSVHEVGLADLLDMSRLSGRLPRPRALVAVQPSTLHWGDAPSPPVAEAIPRLVGEVEGLLAEWG